MLGGLDHPLAVAAANGRSGVGIEINEEYLPLIRERVIQASEHATLSMS